MLRKTILAGVIWVVLTTIFLELILRLTAKMLPERLAIGANTVITGEPFTFDHLTTISQYDIDHYVVLRPDLDLKMWASRDVQFDVVTHSLWEGTIGFRNRPVDYYVNVAVVGDSFAFCFTEYVDCWVSYLEDTTNLGVVNLAQPGTGSMSHWRILDTYARPLEPPLVIWQFFGNDFYEDYQLAVWRGEAEEIDVIEPSLPQHGEESGLLWWLRRHSVAFAVAEIAISDESAYLADSERAFVGAYTVQYRDGQMEFGQPYELEVLNSKDPRVQVGFVETRQALANAQKAVHQWDGQLVVILIPTREEVYSHLTVPIMGKDDIDTLGSARMLMLHLCDELQLLCYDPLLDLQEYAQNGEHLYYSDDLHLNPHGNAVLATLVIDWLTEQGLLAAP